MNVPVDGAKAIVGLRPSFSSHVRFGERGAPVDYRGLVLSRHNRAAGKPRWMMVRLVYASDNVDYR
jgi:hypothetical protein